MRIGRRIPWFAVGVLAATLVAGAWFASAQEIGGDVVVLQVDPATARDIQHDLSPPLSLIARPPKVGAQHQVAVGHMVPVAPDGEGDLDLQTSAGPPPSISRGLGFDGLGNGKFGLTVDTAPSDVSLAAGESQLVEWVNTSFAVFDKSSGSLVAGPFAGNSLWTGFGGGCEANNDGGPQVKYDQIANRWVMSQFSISTQPYLQCVAVSTSPDATGTWYRYAFPIGLAIPRYPKLAVWPDGYYIAWNQFGGNTLMGSQVCALDRESMLIGSDASSECFQTSSSFAGLLPSDLDGSTPPPPGSPSYFMNVSGGALNLWRFHADFARPSAATLFGPIATQVAPYAPACNGGVCISQPGTDQQLDALGDRLMYRLEYRNFGNHDALIANHSVSVGSGKNTRVGVRWYEIRNPADEPMLYQQGTYSPDAVSRWMASAAIDKVGDIALGYSVSSSDVRPGIRVTGRTPNDEPGTMESEATILAGGGSQIGGLNRWGDATSMSVDPVDDCTFWYANQYLPGDGSYNWVTRIASFKFAACQ